MISNKVENLFDRIIEQEHIYTSSAEVHQKVRESSTMKQPKQTPKNIAFTFFLANAGFSYDPKTEARSRGRARCARQLAKAERDAAALGYTFEWTDDWAVGSHVQEYGEESYPTEPSTCESCVCRDTEGKVVASLGCIDDADRNYRRVIEAELAAEALAAYLLHPRRTRKGPANVSNGVIQ
jgi:hypothetical protein